MTNASRSQMVIRVAHRASQARTIRRRGISIVFSYSHRDEKLRNQLDKHLASLKRSGLVRAWYDRKLCAGSDVECEISSHFETADLILLLVSADFLDSDYCYSKELRTAMKRHLAGESRVIPVIIRPVEWCDTCFANLLALPRDGKPITSWPQRDAAFLDVAKGIRRAVEEIYGKSA